MAQPPGFKNVDFPHYVCKLHRSIYGLKQAPRAWFSKLSSCLSRLGFTPCKSDSSLFMKRTSSTVLYLLVYVDDILLIGSNDLVVQHLITDLSHHFSVKDLGQLSYFLGIECQFTKDGLLLSQKKYISDLLQRTNMLECNPKSTPMSSKTKLSAQDGSPLSNGEYFRSVVGSLQYLSFTRPDISFAVNKVCQFLHNPLDSHWEAVKRILRYLSHTSNSAMTIRPGSSFNLTAYSDFESLDHLLAYSDADWAGDIDDRRSTGGYCVFFGPNLISWSSRKQPTVSKSSTEAEYKSLALATCDLIWLQNLLGEIGVSLYRPPTLCCDNIGATYLAANPVMHSRTKHIDLDYHFVRERVAAKALHIEIVSSKDQLADIFTKPLDSPRFQFLRSSLTLTQLPFDLRGDVRGTKSKKPKSMKKPHTHSEAPRPNMLNP